MLIASILVYFSTRDNNQNDEVQKVEKMTVSRELRTGSMGVINLESEATIVEIATKTGFKSILIGTQPANTIIREIGFVVASNVTAVANFRFSIGTTPGTASNTGANDIFSATMLANGGDSNFKAGVKYLIYNSTTVSTNADNELRENLNQRRPDMSRAASAGATVVANQAENTQALQGAGTAVMGTAADRELHINFYTDNGGADQILPSTEFKIFVKLTRVPLLA